MVRRDSAPFTTLPRPPSSKRFRSRRSQVRQPDPAMVISRRYFLTNAEIDEARGDGHRWHEMVRRREFEMLMEHLGRPSFDHALELGAGDGGQSVTIA